jgi:uridylate kinase
MTGSRKANDEGSAGDDVADADHRSPAAALHYRRVLLKISGEALAGDAGFGIDPTAIAAESGSLPPRNAARCSAGHAELSKKIRQSVGQRCADADEKTLHYKSDRALVYVELVCYEGAERLHADIDACVQNPKQTRRNPQRGRVRHKE